MGYFWDGPISLNMKQLFKIHYGLKVMAGGTPIGSRCSGSRLQMFRYQIRVNKITISRISWIWYFCGSIFPSQLEVGGPPKYHQEYMLEWSLEPKKEFGKTNSKKRIRLCWRIGTKTTILGSLFSSSSYINMLVFCNGEEDDLENK